MAIDDMIARAHDVDPNLPFNTGNPVAGLEVARFLGWLTRYRRMRLGKRLLEKCKLAQDGKPHYFSHLQRSRGTAGVYLVTSEGRSDRVDRLKFLVTYAHMKYGVNQCFGVATEPFGRGRSHDFVMRKAPPPPELVKRFTELPDPFAEDEPL